MRVRIDLPAFRTGRAIGAARDGAAAPAVPGSAAVADLPPAAPPAAAPPAPEAWPPLVPAVTPPPGLLGRIATVVAGLSLLAYLVAAVVLAIPVETPGVQDCGSPGAYLLAGRVDRIPDEEGRILGPDGEVLTLDADVAAEARARPCRDRVADRGVPAAVLLVTATLLGVVAFAIELLVVRPRQRREIRAATPPLPDPPAPAPPAGASPPWGAPPGGSGG